MNERPDGTHILQQDSQIVADQPSDLVLSRELPAEQDAEQSDRDGDDAAQDPDLESVAEPKEEQDSDKEKCAARRVVEERVEFVEAETGD